MYFLFPPQNFLSESTHRLLRRMYLCAALFLVFTVFLTCRSPEKLLDTDRSFAPLVDGGAFTLKALPPIVQKVVVNFFAPHCPPCEKEVPELKKFYDKYKTNREIRFIAIGSSLNAVEPTLDEKAAKETDTQMRDELKKFADQFTLPYPQYVASATDLKAWRVTGFPETFVFIRHANGWQLKRKLISEVTLKNLEDVLHSPL